jgi:SAM-dependent methyltransferase
MSIVSKRTFNRSGLAALSDLGSGEWRELFSVLELEQSAFQKMGNEVFDEDYAWPRDPLYQFSRVWEYPYVYHHILQLKNNGLVRTGAHVVDLGSGATFFPFCISKLGFDLICIDNDPVCERNMQRAIKAYARNGININFKASSDDRIPLPDNSVDILYCISVLEHVPDFEPLIDEIARVLIDGGFLLLTVDIDLLPDVPPEEKRFSELSIKRFYRLSSYLEKYFDALYPEKTVHPSDLLHSGVGPYPIRNIRGMELLWFLAKQMLKPVVGKKPSPIPKKLHLAVDGVTLKKK